MAVVADAHAVANVLPDATFATSMANSSVNETVNVDETLKMACKATADKKIYNTAAVLCQSTTTTDPAV